MLRFLCFGWVLLIGLSPQKSFAADSTWLDVSFYSEQIQLPRPNYTTDVPLTGPLAEGTLVSWYQEQEKEGPLKDLLHHLTEQKKRLQLNDWLYYDLIRETAKSLLPHNKLEERLLCWFLLSESDYDTRITFLERQIFLYAYTEESIFDSPMILDNGRKYVNLSSIHEQMNDLSMSLNLLHFNKDSPGKNFSFALQNWPLLTPKIQNCRVSFRWRGEPRYLDLQLDQNAAAIMQHYPIVEEYQYLQMPFSPTLSNSLLPQMRKLLAGKGNKEALEILVAFTRSAFQYKEDRDYFGKNKPMIADELFHYPYSDCEDRSALFFNLVGQLLHLPMVVIAYPDHLTIAVALDQTIGPAISYEGRKYYICDPTGPRNSEQIGQIPEGYEEISFEILGKQD